MKSLSELRVVVTGGAGFLGQFVVERLRQRGVTEVFVPRSRDYDLVDRSAVRRLLEQARPHVVLHLAARVGGIGANAANPASFFYENALMGLHVVHESYAFGVEKLVVLATVCGYPRSTPLPFRETELWNGFPEETNAPYGIAKKILSVQSLAYRKQYGFNSVVLYPANLYGPGDKFDREAGHVIPSMFLKFHEARRGTSEVVLWGDGSPTREFLYVEDCAEAVVLATERYESSEPLNIGSGVETSIRELAQKIAVLTSFQGTVRWNTSAPNGQPRRRLDVSRAASSLGFAARTSLDAGLEKTYRWMLETISAGRGEPPNP